MPVAMELSRIIISEVNDQQVIYLKEVEGERTFPILIGIFEATSIDRRVKGYAAPRPLTHDLIVSIVEQLGGEFQDVVINELKDHTYYARLRVRHNGELVEIDARPSDAIAVALRTKAPIFVAKKVIEKSRKIDLSKDGTDEQSRRQKWTEILENLSPEDFGKYRM